MDQNEAIVPQVAMTTPLAITKPSHSVQRPVSATCADTGPMTQRRNDVNAPRNAIIELKSGMKMATATERHAETVRSITTSRSVTKRGLVVLCCDCASRPKMISRVILTCKGTKIRKDVYLFFK